jgi:hypothetical protein
MNDLALYDESDGLSEEQKRKLSTALGTPLKQRERVEHHLLRFGRIARLHVMW